MGGTGFPGQKYMVPPIEAPLSKAVRQWIVDHDKGLPVYPFSFSFDFPSENIL